MSRLFTCGTGAPAAVVRLLAEGLTGCCVASLEDGPAFCTCWEPVFDKSQIEPMVSGVDPHTRSAPCDDCAFRPDSPERQGDDRYAHAGDLAELDHFWCHDGMRKPTAYRHPAGITVEADADAYDPPIIRGVPYKADGTPGERCAGFEARRRLQS